jgi:uncharacterized protein (DUF885 family)
MKNDTKLDKLTNNYIKELIQLSPDSPAWLGRKDLFDDIAKYSDFSPSGANKRNDLDLKYLKLVEKEDTTNISDKITKELFLQTNKVSVDLFNLGDHLRDVSNLFSPVQSIYQTFDLIPKETDDDFEHIAKRLKNIEFAIDGYIESLKIGLEKNIVPAKRQVELCAIECKKHAGKLSAKSYFDTFLSDVNIPDKYKNDIEKGKNIAKKSYAKLAEFFSDKLLAKSEKDDSVGLDRYSLYSMRFVGAKLNFKEIYEWGIQQFEEISEKQFQIAKKLGAKSENRYDAIAEITDILNKDDNLILKSPESFEKWMQKTSDEAMQYVLKNKKFDVPKAIQKLNCKIVKTDAGTVYYNPPSDDLKRPGTMWWSVTPNDKFFSKWEGKTTVYHEGVPGHHLQVARQVYNKDLLNDFRRNAFISGFGEGWALYAEQLMDEFGFLSLPEQLGTLFGKKLRAVRIIIDIGVHLKFDIPTSWQKHYGKGAWTYESAKKLLFKHIMGSKDFLTFELNRYMGMPGQAISYLVGMKKFLSIREKVVSTNRYSLKEFHSKTLDIGAVTFDILEKYLLGTL